MQLNDEKEGADIGIWPFWSNRVRPCEYQQHGIITEANKPKRTGVPLEGPYPTEY